MQAKSGRSRYGDPQYVPHVSRRCQMANLIGQTPSIGIFSWPLSVERTSTFYFGYRIHPVSWVRKFHSGIDIAAPYGTSVLASVPDTVSRVKYLSTVYGYNAMIDQGNGLQTLYVRMSVIYVIEGQPIIPVKSSMR